MDDYETWIVSDDDEGVLQSRTVWKFSDELIYYGAWHHEDGCHEGEALEYRRIKKVWASTKPKTCDSGMSFPGGYSLSCSLPPHPGIVHEYFNDKYSTEWECKD